MGEAKRRRAEIEVLKLRSPEQAAKYRQSQQDKRALVGGIRPASGNPEPTMALARLLRGAFEEAKISGTIDAPISLYQSAIGSTLEDLSNIPVACRRGCSHCCHIWVTVTAPEVLHIAKVLKGRGDDDTIASVRSMNELTKHYDFDARDDRTTPCPLLKDHICSIYEHRPMVCRLAASADADVCARTYHHISDEEIPTPLANGIGLSWFVSSIAMALHKTGLPYDGYELNAALTRALDTDDAERRWLSGENIFHDVLRDTTDVLAAPEAQEFCDITFRNAP